MMMFDVTNTYVLKFNDDFYDPIMAGIKTSTIRDEPKPINKGDIIDVCFKPSERTRTIKILRHYAIKFKDINNDIAKREGYLHKTLLEHELKNIYPNLKSDDYIYVYEFMDTTRL